MIQMLRAIGLNDIRSLGNLHHISNITLSALYIFMKCVPFICSRLFETCGFDTREHETLIFLAVIIVWKNRKASNFLHYLSTVYLFSKVANCFLFFRSDPLLGIVYCILCLIVTVLVPEPVYAESDKVTYFQGEDLFNEVQRDRRITWVVEFYTSWSPECRHLTPTFSKLSERFTLPNLRFAKLDVGRYPKEGERFRINVHPSSRQLPTIALFRNGEQVVRRPTIGSNKRAIPFKFSEENCVLDFDLLNIHAECKKAKICKDQEKKDE